MKKLITAVALALGLTSAAVAQDIGTLFVQITLTVVGTVAGNVIVSGMDGASCGATAAINTAIRKNSNGGYRHDADYDTCIAMTNARRQYENARREAKAEMAAAVDAQNAPRSQCQAHRRVDEYGRVYTTEDCNAQIIRGGYRNW